MTSNHLSDKNADRLKKWQTDRANVPTQPFKQPPKRPLMPPYVPRRGDYGDDYRDIKDKSDRAWQNELTNPNRAP